MDDFDDLPSVRDIVTEERRRPLLNNHNNNNNANNHHDSHGMGTKKLTFGQALLTSLNYNLGLSLLCFPYNLSLTGWSGIVALLFASTVTWCTGRMIGIVMREHTEIKSYADIATAACRCVSEKQAMVSTTTGVLRIFQITELLFYLVFSYVTVQEAILELGISSATILSFILCAVFVVVTDPVLLSKLSFVGLVFWVVLYLLLAGNSIGKLISMPTSEYHMEWKIFEGTVESWFVSYGSILLLFAGHAVYPSIHENLQDKKDYNSVLDLTFLLIITMAVFLGVITCLAFGKDAKELPTTYLESGTWINSLGQICIIIKSLVAFPLILYPIVLEIIGFVVVVKSPSKEISVIPRTPLLSLTPGANTLQDQLQLLLDEIEDGDHDDDNDDMDTYQHHIAQTHIPVTYSPFIGVNSGAFSPYSPRPPHTNHQQHHNRNNNNNNNNNVHRVDDDDDDDDDNEGGFSFSKWAKLHLLFSPVLYGFIVACFTFLLSVIVPSLSFVMSLTGALFAICLAITFPSICFFCVYPFKNTFSYVCIPFALFGFSSTLVCLAFLH